MSPTRSSDRAAAYVREPYFFSDIGPLRIQQVGTRPPPPSSGARRTGSPIGRDPGRVPRCVLLLNAPARLREARELLAAATADRPIHTLGGPPCPSA